MLPVGVLITDALGVSWVAVRIGSEVVTDDDDDIDDDDDDEDAEVDLVVVALLVVLVVLELVVDVLIVLKVRTCVIVIASESSGLMGKDPPGIPSFRCRRYRKPRPAELFGLLL